MLVIANWKAYVESRDEAKGLFALAKRLSKQPKMTIVLAPPAPFLGMLASGNKSKVAFAAQDISEGTGGAHTGEITAPAFAGSGASHALVGHSERRAQGETNTQIAEKLAHALAHGLTPVLCIGEATRDDNGTYLAFVRGQITEALKPLSPQERARIIFAYEPIWAIGKNAAAAIAASDLAEMILYIRKVVAELLPGKAGKVRVLYGGSVEPENIRALAGGTSVDGFLVGHASVDPKMFPVLVKALS